MIAQPRLDQRRPIEVRKLAQRYSMQGHHTVAAGYFRIAADMYRSLGETASAESCDAWEMESYRLARPQVRPNVSALID